MERRKFTREFNVEAVKLIQERGVTVAQVARDFGVQGTVLRRWVRESAADMSEAFPGQGQMKPEQAELARLRRAVIKLNPNPEIEIPPCSLGSCLLSFSPVPPLSFRERRAVPLSVPLLLPNARH